MRSPVLSRFAALLLAAGAAVTVLTASAQAAETGTISGTLTDHHGTAIPFGIIDIYSDRLGNFTDEVFADDHGVYSATGLEPGTYRVLFRAVGHPDQWAHDAYTQFDAAPITVGTGITTVVDESLLEPGFIQGQVVDGAGQGVGGVGVRAFGDAANGVSTPPDGTYRLPVLPGTYRVGFGVPGGTQYAFGTRDEAQAATFTIAAGQTVTVNDRLLATGSVQGRVVRANGTAAAGLHVWLFSDVLGWPLDTTTDAGGDYVFPQLFAGAYQVMVTLPSGQQQWAPQARDRQHAGSYQVVQDGVTTLDVTLLPTGSVAGHFTGATGAVNIEMWDSRGSQAGYTNSDANGDFRIDDVLTDDYRVHFRGQDNLDQWAHGKVRQQDADVFHVTAGQTTTVDETRLPAGNVRVTARDAVTGAPILRLWGQVGQVWGFTENGTLDLTGIPAGTQPMEFFGEGYDQVAGTVTVQGGQTTPLALDLTPLSSLSITVVDAVTGAPVPGVCIDAHPLPFFYTTDGCGPTDDQGHVLFALRNGDYKLFVNPPSQTSYGAQWFGANGNGTGDQRQAKVFHMAPGQGPTPVTIKLDRAGTIRGTVTSETGLPPHHGKVFVATTHPSLGAGYYLVDENGHYSIDWLGPYKWPIGFAADGHAAQWSGGVGNRFDAQTIQVTSGGTTTYNPTLKVGTKITGAIAAPDGTLSQGWLLLYEASTGDIMGWTDVASGQPYLLRVLGPQTFKLQHQAYAPSGTRTPWLGGEDFATAQRLGAGTRQMNLDLCLNTDSSAMRVCSKLRRGVGEPSPPPPRRSAPPSPEATAPPRRG